MKKSILTISFLAIVSFFAFRTPPVSTMQFETIGVNLYQLPSYNPADTSFTWTFLAWYGVKNNPYIVKKTDAIGMVTNATWCAWEGLTMKTKTTDATVALKTALDSANAYRQRNYPDIQ